MQGPRDGGRGEEVVLASISTTTMITLIVQESREKLCRLEVGAGSQGEELELRLSHGSVEDLSRLVQQELELSNQLDNSLLSQVLPHVN